MVWWAWNHACVFEYYTCLYECYTRLYEYYTRLYEYTLSYSCVRHLFRAGVCHHQEDTSVL